ncbi:ABC transporter permease [Devosia enhydra]|nr:ABC transporter permease [Devosia enhydra]
MASPPRRTGGGVDFSALLSRFDRLGVIVALIVAAGSLALPFVTFKANRIAPGQPLGISEALAFPEGPVFQAVILAGALVALIRLPSSLRLAAGLLLIAALGLMLGVAATGLMPEGSRVARVSPAAGFWLLVFAFALVAADALARMQLGPMTRLGLLALVALGLGLMLWSGLWDDVSILREYANRGAAFRSEAQTHFALAFGSLGAATLIGVPLGILSYRNRALRTGVLNSLNVVQTIPSIALFGLLIAPLSWVAANIPGASALGVSGIGFAPAMLALFGYSLLPIVANTVAGLEATPEPVRQAARGMGMTRRQILTKVELPLALPVIIAGIRIVLVQNIGLATIAALIGGGGFGVFVFQGIGQTAMDLVLLGAVPTVALAMAAAIVLDAVVDLASPGQARPR